MPAPVVGWVNRQAVIATNGTVETIPIPEGFTVMQPAAINELGHLAGRVVDDRPGNKTQREVLVAGDIVTVLDPAPGMRSSRQSSSADDLNDLGQVVGSPGFGGSHVVHENGRAFLYDSGTGTTTDLGTLPDYQNSLASAINNAGHVVGSCWLPKNWQFGDATDYFRSAYVYDHRTCVMTDLNQLIPQGTGWYLFDAFAINDGGQIVGQGMIGGEMHAVLLTPNR